MTFSVLLSSILKTAVVTILGDIAMKSIEQKDYARLIRFTGVSQAAVDITAWLKHVEKNPPLLIRLTKESYKGWKGFMDDWKGFADFLNNLF